MTAAPGVEGRPAFVRFAVLGLLFYWFLHALLLPVTVWDSHVYNIARLLVIEKGGFFGNHVWNCTAQLSYPWSFDAVHYPLLWLGAGYALPSFACLLGILVVVHRLVTPRYGEAVAWWCDLTLLAMPTVVYQATSTKNDLVGAFCVAVWFYALVLWNERRQRVYLFWMALALAFDAGTKLSGLPVAGLLSLWSFWKLRALPRRQIFQFAGMLGFFFLCFGSAETYLNNWLLFRHPLGPPEYMQFQRNRDGVLGGLANFIRYFFGTMNIGVYSAQMCDWMRQAGLTTMRALHLGNVGYRSDFNDASFSILKLGMEAASDYGPVGALALFTAFCLCVVRPPRDVLWKLSSGGLAALAVTCLTVGWMPWNNRYLLLPFILFGVALTLRVSGDGPQVRLWRAGLIALSLVSAVGYPWYSFNRMPRDLRYALTHREALALQERGSMQEIVDDLKRRVQAGQSAPLLLTAGENAWTYDILTIKHLDVLPTPRLDPAALADAQKKTGASRLLVLALDRRLDPALTAQLAPLTTYAEADCALYQWPRLPAANALAPGPAARSGGHETNPETHGD